MKRRLSDTNLSLEITLLTFRLNASVIISSWVSIVFRAPGLSCQFSDRWATITKQPPALTHTEQVYKHVYCTMSKNAGPMVTITDRFHLSVYTHYASKQVFSVYRLLAVAQEMTTTLLPNDGWYTCLFGLYQPNISCVLFSDSHWCSEDEPWDSVVSAEDCARGMQCQF